MNTLHDGSDLIPGATGLPLRDPHQEQGKKADKDMGSNAFVFPVVDGPELQGRLERPECPLHLQKLLVAQGNILGTERVIAGGDDVLAVEVGVIPDPALVYGDGTALELPNIPAHGSMGHQGADRFLVKLPLLVPYGGQEFLYPPENPLSRSLVTGGLFGIVDQDEPPAAFTIADNDLLDQHVVPNLLVPSTTGKDLLVDLLGIPELLPQNVVSSGLLDGDPVLFTVHAPVCDPDAPGESPAQQVVLDLLDGGHVRGIARQGPALHRDALLGHGKADDHLGQVRTVVLGMAIPPQAAFVLLVPLDVRARGIEEEQVHLQVQQVGGGEEDLLVDVLRVFQQDIHGPVEVLQLDGLGIAEGNVLSCPFLNTSLGLRGERPVGNHGEDSPLHRRREGSPLQAFLQGLVDAQLFPQRSEQVGASHGHAPDELQGVLPLAGSLCLQGILRGEKSAEASDKSSDGLDIQAVRPAEGEKDIGTGVASPGIPDVVGELDIGGGCSVLVLPGDGSDVHASLSSMYYTLLQAINALAHAYSYFIFQKDRPACFLNPPLKTTPKYAYDCQTWVSVERIITCSPAFGK